MKFLTLLFVINVHVHAASIYGDLRDVMSSLENSFQKMITDVVTDVRDTIDCTVDAVESALSFGSTSNHKCRAALKEYQDKNDNRKYIPSSILSDDSFNVHNDRNYIKDISRLSLNEDLKYLPIDDDRLMNIKSFLKDELEKMSASMRIQFKQLETEEKSATDALITYINILHKLKHDSKNDSEMNEAKRMLDGASKILNVKNHNTNNAKVNKLLTTLEGSQHDNGNITNTLSKIADNKFTNNMENSPNSSTRNFKDIFKKPLSTTREDNKGEIKQEIEHLKSSPFNVISHSNKDDKDEIDYDSLFGGAHSETNDDAIDEATKILADSKKTNSILNKFFATSSQAGNSIFDN